MNPTANVPKEMLHIYQMVEKAGRFSVLAEGAGFQPAGYDSLCEALFQESAESRVVALRWFHDNPRYAERHKALEAELQVELEGFKNGGGRIRLSPNLEHIRFIWRQAELEGIFRCGILLSFNEAPAALNALFESTSGPHVVQGANDAFRSATARARALSRKGQTVLLVRRGEVEVFADSGLPELFSRACSICRSV